MASDEPAIRRLLEAHRGGEPGALDALVALLYDELKRLAHFQLRKLQPWETLNTTGLVHETYLKIAEHQKAPLEGRGHFLGAAAKAMRHILVDAARRRLSQKKGEGQKLETLEDHLYAAVTDAETLLTIDQALEELRSRHERMAQVIECQFFAGYSKEETAEVLGVSVRTVHRDWIQARGWLRRRLG